jgi:nucleoside-diphosphate-sugar epimerase
MNIAIMGATSHIAKGLIQNFIGRGQDNLHLFSRSTGNIQKFLSEISRDKGNSLIIYTGYENFLLHSYDIIINCVGVETRNKYNCDFTRYFSVTEEFDNLAISYLKIKNNDTLYISFSSGAIYGKGFLSPATDNAVNNISVNHTALEDYYGIARLNAEAKHRAHNDLKIIDLRIFSYFSRYINLSDGYFITDVIRSIMKNKRLVIDRYNITRDYLHMEDLFSMIILCAAAGRVNRAFDVNSLNPISKQEILDYFASAYALTYEYRDKAENASATGAKNNYFSTCTHATQVGFAPRYSSMDTIKLESEIILSQQGHLHEG